MKQTHKLLKSFITHESRRTRQLTEFSDDFEWITEQSRIGYLPLEISIPHETILSEIANIEHLFVPHRQIDQDNVGWLSFCIHGRSYDATTVDTGELIWTPEAIELMPNTVDFFKNHWFNNQFLRLRVMKLEPNGYITLHRDNKPPSRLGPVNIAITNPVGNNFAMEKHGIIPFEPGKAIMLNVSNNHAVLNESSIPRYHIIAHHSLVTEDFKKMVVKSYQKLVQNTN